MEFEFHDQFATELAAMVRSDPEGAFAMYTRLDTIRLAGRIVEDIFVTINNDILIFVIEVSGTGLPMLVYQDGSDALHPGVVRCLPKTRFNRTEIDALADEVALLLGIVITSKFYPDEGH